MMSERVMKYGVQCSQDYAHLITELNRAQAVMLLSGLTVNEYIAKYPEEPITVYLRQLDNILRTAPKSTMWRKPC